METTPFSRRTHLPWLVEWVIRWLAVLLYRVRSSGAERFPARGGVLVVANHLSYVDPLLIQLACPRPIRFVGAESVRRSHAWMDWLFRVSGTITVSPDDALETTRRVVRALAAGEVVCVFPEGEISRTGQLLAIQRGFEVMARRAHAPVVAVAHDGIWGSVFSFSGNQILLKSPRLKRTPIFVAWGAPLAATEATRDRIRRELLDLGAEAFHQRPVLQRHLAAECVRALTKRPGRLSVVDRTAEPRPVTAGRLLAAACALSRHVRRTIPDPRVGIVLPPGAGAMIANLAVLIAGKTPVNLNFTAGRAAVEAGLRLGGIRTVLSARVVQTKLPQFPWPEQTLDVRELIEAAGGKRAVLPWLVAAWLLPNQVLPWILGIPRRGDRAEAGLLFTSGSSGEPKGVPLTHRNILANCWQISSLSILPDDARLLGCLPLFHSFGFTVTLWYPLIRGCRLITVPSPLDTRKIIDAVRDEEVDTLVGAPTFLRPFLKKAERSEFRSLHLVVSGAERLPRELYDAYFDRFHTEIMQGYGLTETSPVTNVNQADPPVLTESAAPQAGKRFGTVGRMMPGMTARIVDPETFAPRPLTEAGMLLFKGANVFEGYLDDPEKTAAAFRDGWFVTGDIGRFDEDGFLIIEGRLSRFSKIGGEMVPHGTVEQTIVDLFHVDQSEAPQVVVLGVPDPAKGEALVLLTTLDLRVEDLRSRLLDAGLPALWVPKIIQRVERIPVLGTGKLDLKACRQQVLPA